MSESAFGIEHGHFSKGLIPAIPKLASAGKHVKPTGGSGGKRRADGPSKIMGGGNGGARKGASAAGKQYQTFKGKATDAYGSAKNYAMDNPGKSALIGGGGLALTGGVYAAGKSSGRDKNGQIR